MGSAHTYIEGKSLILRPYISCMYLHLIFIFSNQEISFCLGGDVDDNFNENLFCDP